MNEKYYNKDFQSKALKWWRTLSINEQKAFEKKLPIMGDNARHSEIAEIYNYVKPDCAPKAINK